MLKKVLALNFDGEDPEGECLDNDLLISIAVNGVLEPIHIDESDNVLDGRKRVLLATAIGLVHIPCILWVPIGPVGTSPSEERVRQLLSHGATPNQAALHSHFVRTPT